MTSEDKLKSVEAQVILIERSELVELLCPYCDTKNEISPEKALCCEMLCKAVNAVIDRRELAEVAIRAERVMEKVYKEKPLVTLN